jgi:conserved oligomeric Golgi complex subunit 4
MTGRWSLFKKFLTERLRVSYFRVLYVLIINNQGIFQDDYQNDDDEQGGAEILHAQPRAPPRSTLVDIHPSNSATSPVFEPREILLIESTASHQLFENLLTTYYLPLELWYTRTTIDKVSSHAPSSP